MRIGIINLTRILHMFNSQGFKYAVPALLYAVHNNLIFVALLADSYSSVQRERARDYSHRLTAGYTRAMAVADLGRITGQCDCPKVVRGASPRVSKPISERCGVTRAQFERGPVAGKYRCCEGYDCPLDVCSEERHAPPSSTGCTVKSPQS